MKLLIKKQVEVAKNNDKKGRESLRKSCEKYTRFRNSTNYEIEKDIQSTYKFMYGNSNYGRVEELQEISNTKLCKLNNFYK